MDSCYGLLLHLHLMVIVRCKWVYIFWQKLDGSFEWYRAVANGCHQHGIDFDEMFNSIWIVLFVAISLLKAISSIGCEKYFLAWRIIWRGLYGTTHGISGFIHIRLNQNLVSWSTKMQPIVLKASANASIMLSHPIHPKSNGFHSSSKIWMSNLNRVQFLFFL